VNVFMSATNGDLHSVHLSKSSDDANRELSGDTGVEGKIGMVVKLCK